MNFFFISIYLTQKQKTARQKSFEILLIIGLVIFLQLATNLIFRQILSLPHPSPSKTLPLAVNIGQYHFWHNNYKTSHSFPANHAITLFTCLFFACANLAKKRALSTALVCLLLLLPRLMVGGHWLTDVIFGGFTFGLFCWALFFKTPLYAYLKNKLAP